MFSFSFTSTSVWVLDVPHPSERRPAANRPALIMEVDREDPSASRSRRRPTLSQNVGRSGPIILPLGTAKSTQRNTARTRRQPFY